jgi:acyl carrier protein
LEAALVLEQRIIDILGHTLQLDGRIKNFDKNTPLLGNVPELDSVAVISVLTAIEEEFGIAFDDDEITASTFETVGSLIALTESKVNEPSAPPSFAA